MGFFSDLFNIGKELVQKGIGWLGDQLEKIGKKLQGPKIIDRDRPGPFPNEEYEKNQTQLDAEIIAEYQKEIEARAIERETEIKKMYKKIYNKYIYDFKDVFDEDVIKSLKAFIQSKENIFQNTLRNEVNSKVNPSCRKWQLLISRNASHSEIQSYCDRVYTDADNNLLDLLQEAIEDTNEYICNCIKKYNEDKTQALVELKKSLRNLVADEDTNAKELKKISEELAVAEFISHEANPKE